MQGVGFCCWGWGILLTAFVFSSNCGECFIWSFNTEFCLLLGVFFCMCGGFAFNSLQAVAVSLLFGLLLLGLCVFGFVCVFGFFWVEWVGRITNYFNFFYTVPFLEIHYPCAKYFYCLLYSTTMLKYNCIAGTVTEQLSYRYPLTRSCVPLKTKQKMASFHVGPSTNFQGSSHYLEKKKILYVSF